MALSGIHRIVACGVYGAVALIVSISIAACDKTPDAPEVTPGQPESVTGGERIGWTQTAANRTELELFHYAIYLNDVRSELQGATCQIASSRATTGFECSAPLPALSAGASRIELATFIIDGQVFESARSAPLLVNKIAAASVPPDAPPAAKWPSGLTFTTSDGLRLRLERRLGGLVRPTDIAFVPDGRLLIAEESGRVVVLMPDGRVGDARALPLARRGPGTTRLLSLAVDPNFESTRSVYAVYTTTASNGSRVFALSRFSEASNALFGEVVLLDRIPASTAAAASVRMSADGKLFVAFDDGGDPRRAGDLASPSGKLLRLNPDGTTPDDQAGLTPTYAADFHSPRGFDWQPGSRVLWIADHLTDDAASLTGVASTPGAQRRGVRVASYSLPRESPPSAAAFIRNSSLTGFDNDLLIASAEGRHLLRVRFDAAAGTRAVATERLLQDVVGAVRVVAVGSDGGVYIATDDAVAQITMAE